jgi:hypothetical protein
LYIRINGILFAFYQPDSGDVPSLVLFSAAHWFLYSTTH